MYVLFVSMEENQKLNFISPVVDVYMCEAWKCKLQSRSSTGTNQSGYWSRWNGRRVSPSQHLALTQCEQLMFQKVKYVCTSKRDKLNLPCTPC